MGFFDFLKNKVKKVNESDIEESLNEVNESDIEEVLKEEVESDIEESFKEEVESDIKESLKEEVESDIEESFKEEVESDIKEDLQKIDEITLETAINEDTVVSDELGEDKFKECELIDEGIAEENEIEDLQADNDIETVNEPETKEVKKGFFARLLEGLDKTRKNILGGVDAVLGGFTKIDEDLFEELEEVLIMADIGVDTTMGIIENLRKRVKRERTADPKEIKGMLIDEITEILNEGAEDSYEMQSPTVLLVIGVNGVGKTTTIGKLSSNFKGQGKKVLLAAADTFRAAAIDQLEVWGQRAGIDVIKHEENSDPAAVIFDAVNAAKNRKSDILICDTAGRLHNKKNLMEELKKIAKVINREYPSANKEVYLVLDATTGQNALQQAKLFKEVADISGIILTKLDGTAKGGIVIAIKSELKIPVRYIGVGEGINDLQKFNAKDFARALFGEE